jgi:hypothetical protein
MTVRLVCPEPLCRRAIHLSVERVPRIRVHCMRCGTRYIARQHDGYVPILLPPSEEIIHETAAK